MRLTKLQRHTAYILMLAELGYEYDEYRFCYFCHAAEAIGLVKGDFDYEFQFLLPELWSKKPERPHFCFAWFGGGFYKTRVNILEQCISETY